MKMPEQFPYPEQGWSTGRMKKVGDPKEADVTGGDETIQADKSALQQVAQAWQSGKMAWEDVNKEIEKRNWSAQAPIRAPGDTRPISPRDIFDMYRFIGEKFITKAPEITKASGEANKQAHRFMKLLGFGVLTLLDPRQQVHEIPLEGSEESK
jgi:hypothetical protein